MGVGSVGVVEKVAHIMCGADLMAATYALIDGKSEKELYDTYSRIHGTVKYQLFGGALPALQIVFDLMLDPENSPQTRLQAALAVLDRAGHGTKSLPTGDSPLNVTPNINEMSSDDITKALQGIQNKLESLSRPSASGS